MPDNKQYYVQIPAEGDGQGQEKVVDAQSYENHKDELFNAYKNASVKELTDINPAEQFDYRADDEFEVSVDDLGEKKVVSADQFVKNMDKLYKAYPNARVTRRRNVDYWGPKLDTLNQQISQLEQNRNKIQPEFNKALMEGREDIVENEMDPSAALQAARSSAEYGEELEVIGKRLESLYKERDENPAWQAGKTRQADNLNATIAGIDEQMEALKKKNPKAYNAYWAKHTGSRGGMLTPAQLLGNKKDQDFYFNKDWESFAAAKLMYKEAAKTANAPSRYDETSGFANFFRGLAGGAGEVFTPANLAKAGLNAHLVDAIKRIQDAEGKNANIIELIQKPEYLGYLSEGERELVKAFVVKSAIDAQRAGDLSLGYQSGKTAMESLGFMADFLMFGGIGESAAKAVTKPITRGLAKASVNAGLKGATREVAQALPKFLEGTLQSAVKTLVMSPLMPSSYANFTNGLLQMNDAGAVDLSGKAIMNTIINDVFIENLSENAGAQVEKILGFALKPIGKGAKFLGEKTFGEVPFDKWIKIYKNSPVTKLLTQAGFNGYFGEVGEEWYGNALRVLLGTDKNALKDFSTMENLIVTHTAFAPMSLLGLGASLAQYKMSTKRLGETADALQAVLAKNGYSQEKIDNILAVTKAESPSQFTPEGIAKQLAPVINQVAKDNIDAAPEVFKAACDYARAVADWRLFDGVHESDVNDKREAMFQEIADGTGVPNWYTSVQSNADAVTEEGEAPHKIDFEYVRFIDDADGHRWFVLSDVDGKLALVDKAGQKRLLDQAELELGIANGEMTDSGQMHMPDFLDMELTARDKAAETERMQAESTRNANDLYSTAQIGTEVEIGTPENPNKGVIRQITPDGFLVEAADGVHQYSPEQMAGFFNLPYRPETDEEIENKQLAEEERSVELRNRANAAAGQVNIAPALGLEGEATLLHVFEPQRAQDGTIQYQVNYDVNGQETIGWISEDQLTAIVSSAEQKPAAAVKEETATIAEARSDVPVDFRGNPLPMRTNSITGEQQVDGESLWKKDPEAWAYWNDTNPNQKTTSQERLEYNIGKLAAMIQQKQAEIHGAALEGVDDSVMDQMDHDLSELQQRAATLTSILQKYAEPAAEQPAPAGEQVAEEQPTAEVEQTAEQPTAVEETPVEMPVPETPKEEEIAAAREEVDTNPTEAQKEAGNYKKGHITLDGYDITLENPKGSTRSGVDASGKEWSQVMNNDYGYIRMTEGVDGDHIDVFLSDHPEQGNVFVVDQVNPSTGEFDEHKVMYGFGSAEEAAAAYLSNYEEGWQGLGTITEVSKDEFKKWVDSSTRKTKPFAEYKSVNVISGQNAGTSTTSETESGSSEKPNTQSTETPAEAAQDLDAVLADKGRTAILKRIDKWKKLLGDVFVVHDDISTVTNEQALARIREEDKKVADGEPRDVHAVRGWYEPETGKAHIYLPHLLEMTDRKGNLDETILHEVVSHKGLRALQGKHFDEFMDIVWGKLMTPAQQQYYLDYVNGTADSQRSRRAAADEFLAHAAEKNQAIVKEVDATFWTRLADAFKDFINTIFGEQVFKEADTDWFSQMLQAAAEAVREESEAVQGEESETRMSVLSNIESELDKDGISIDDKALLDAYGLKNVTLSKHNDVVTLTHFIANERGKGNGTRFMSDLAQLADQNGWTLALTPDTTFGATSVGRLKDFYKRFGFRENKGRNADYAISESMIRTPGMPSDTRFSIRTKPAPKKTGVGYKAFYRGKDGKLYPAMVANPNGAPFLEKTWLDADMGEDAGTSKTGRRKVKAGGKGTRGGGGTLSFRPGFHLGEIPYALQFNVGPKVDNPLGIRNQKGEIIKVGKYFPKDLVWAEVEYDADKDYQEEAMSYGRNEAGNFQHSLAGLPRIPEDGYYKYRTNANPATDPWIITGAMKIKRVLSNEEVDDLVRAAGREPQLREDSPAQRLEQEGFSVDEKNDDVRFSVRYSPDEKEAKQVAKNIAAETGRSLNTAKRWVKSETSLAAIILDEMNAPYLDYEADDRFAAIKKDSDYPQGTVDFNNICRKRIEFTNLYQRIQKAYPNVIITGEDLATIRDMMKRRGITVACGLCYVEDRRQLLGEIAKGFIEELKGNFEDYAKGSATKQKNAEKFRELVGNDKKDDLNIYDLITLEGSTRLSQEHPGIYAAFNAFNAARGQQAGNLFQGYAEYKREILKWSPAKVKSVNDNGGLRVFSYSDFEAHHLIDLVQIIQDCATKGVMVQGYTKVPAFARAVANTNIKLNRSLIPLGDTGIVDGKLAYDPVEGIDINDKDFLESNDNVGNILIGINDEQIRLAMADPFVHYIIPYHSNQSGVLRQMKQTGAWTNYRNEQTDKGPDVGKHGVNIYTDVLAAAEAEGKPIRNEKQFVEKFLSVCKERGWTPRFERFLNKNKKGDFVYTPGYYKLLLDFKLFDEQGRILPQKPVVAEFDDEFNAKILNDYVAGEKTKNTKELDRAYKDIVKALNLDERENDVRFSVVTKEQDKEYMEAVEAGNMPTAERLVYEAAQKTGYTISAYHGGPHRFNVFDKSKLGVSTKADSAREGFFFTDWPGQAGEFALESTRRADSDAVLADIKRQVDEMDDAKVDDVFEYVLKSEGFVNYLRPSYNDYVSECEDKGIQPTDEGYLQEYARQNFKEGQNISKRQFIYESIAENYNGNYWPDVYAFADEMKDFGINVGHVFDVFLKMENPYIDEIERDYTTGGDIGDDVDVRMTNVLKKAKAEGHDGVIFKYIKEDNRYGFSPQYVVFEPNQIKSAEPIVRDDKGEVIPLSERFNPQKDDIRFSMTAYHGSGATFNRFDHSHMGEGQGAQSHGWGTYLALNEDTSKRYAEVMGYPYIYYEGDEAPTYYAKELLASVAQEMENGKGFEEVKKRMLDMLKDFEQRKNSGQVSDYWKNVSYKKEIEFFENLKESNFKRKKSHKNLYTVEIPEDTGDNYIDENKKLSEGAIKKIADRLRDVPYEDWNTKGWHFAKGLEAMVNAVESGRFKGKGLYSDLTNGLGSPKASSQFLANAGIVGMKYDGKLDGPCVVIFNEKDADIKDNTRFSIKTYHGSGADFDRFNHSHMGEGEGSQSYGYGTYVSTNRDTGLQYARTIGGAEDGRLYTVEIPDDNGQNYLHWDGYLTKEQCKKIIDAVREQMKKDGSWYDEAEYELKSSLGYGTVGRYVEGSLDYFLGDMKNYATGEDPGAKRNAELLKSLGIIGMEIPVDRKGGQRYAGSNYVIFDDADLNIVEKTKIAERIASADAKQKVADDKGEALDQADIDEVRFSLSKNNKATITRWLEKRTDLSKEERSSVLDYIDGLDNAKLQLATARWFAGGTIRLPEDMEKVQQAVSVAEKAKVDPLQYSSPMELLNAHANFKASEKRINPDDVPTLHKAQEIPENGIVIYDVDESDESRENMRQIINTHFGKDASPWCLLQGDDEGNLTERSKGYWKHYSAYPKQVAFKDGKLLAFSANDSKERVWWDRQDESHSGIPVTMKMPGDELGRTATYELSGDGTFGNPTNIHRGNMKNGLYEVWEINKDGKEVLTDRQHYKDGKLDGSFERWFTNGQPFIVATYREGNSVGDYLRYYNDGSLHMRYHYDEDGQLDGEQLIYNDNGKLKNRANYVHGLVEGMQESWDDNGTPRRREEYHGGLRNGLSEEFYENGQRRHAVNYKNGHMNGLSESWYEDGQLKSRVHSVDGIQVGKYEGWYENGERDYVYNYDEHGDEHGACDEYNKNGQLVHRTQYNHGVKEGVEQGWLQDGKVQYQMMWKDGKKNGFYQYFYPDGQVRDRMTYENDLENGVSEWFHSDGSLIHRLLMKDGRAERDLGKEPQTSIYTDTGEIAAEEAEKYGIRFSVTNMNQQVFVSNAQAAVENIQNEKATPEQWLNQLTKNGGLKAAEDKWLGLSDWLKAQDKKTVTKQEILDFIEQNRIQIEEEHYADLEYSGALDALQQEYDTIPFDDNEALWKEADDRVAEFYGDMEDKYGEDYLDEMNESERVTEERLLDEREKYAGEQDVYQAAFDAMVEKYGDDFSLAFGQTGGKLYVNDSDAAAHFLGVKQINSTREGYTTEGLDNKREIALTVPTIEPYNERDDIHFGDAGEGRAVAWARFGDTSVSAAESAAKKAYEDADKAWRDYKQEVTNKYALKATGTKPVKDLATPEENARVQELYLAAVAAENEWRHGRHAREKVLFIDEIQSKRHQDARELGGYKDDTLLKQAEAARDAKREELDRFLLDMDAKYKNAEAEHQMDVYSDEDRAEYQRLYREWRNAEDRVARKGFDPMDDEEYRRMVAEHDAMQDNPEMKRIAKEWTEVVAEMAPYYRIWSGNDNDEERKMAEDAIEPLVERRNELEAQLKPYQDASQELLERIGERQRELVREFNEAHTSNVPAAPFEKNWHELTMKRMLRLAAEEGYDYVAWTTGDQQAERYNIGNYVSSLNCNDIDENGRTFGLYLGESDESTELEVDNNGIVVRGESHLSQAEGHPLHDLVGKDLAVKMMQMEIDDTLEDVDLNIGNNGMRGFYDGILVNFMNKYSKKWGVKVEDMEIPGIGTEHAVPVTAEMRESVLQGQPMFSVTSQPQPVQAEGEGELEFLNRCMDYVGSKYRWATPRRVFIMRPALPADRQGSPEDIGGYANGIIYIFARKGQQRDYETYETGFFHENFHAFLDQRGLSGNSSFVDSLLNVLQDKRLVTNISDKVDELRQLGYDDARVNEEVAVRFVADAMARGLASRLEADLTDELNNVLNDYYNTIGYDKAEETSSRTGVQSRGRAAQGGDTTSSGDAGAGVPGDLGGRGEADVQGNPGGDYGTAGIGREAKRQAVRDVASALGVEVEFKPAAEMTTANGKHLAGRWQDGRISVCVENCRSTDDAVRTVIHEAVGHNGLRKLVGAQDMRAFALTLYRQLPAAARREITDAAFSQYGGNIVEAVEEWLAERSEDMSFDKYEDLTAWDRVRDAVRRLFARFGIGPRLTDNDIRWILWQSYYANKEEDLPLMARRFALAHRLGFSASQQDDRSLAQSVTRNKVAEEVSAARLYNMAVQSAKARLHEVFVDKDDAVNRLVEAIEKSSGKPAQDFEDVRLALNQQSSKGLAATEKFIREKYNPMMEAIKAIVKEGALSVEDIERYVKIKHGIERNEVFAKRDARNYYRTLADKEIKKIKESDAEPDIKDSLISREKSKLDKHLESIDNGTDGKYKEFRKKDYGGLTSMYSEYDDIAPYQEGVESYEEYQARALKARHPMYETLEETEEAAEREVRSFEESVGSNLTDELWKRINAATKATLQEQYKSNMMSKRQYEIVRDMFKFYVPLRGFKDNVASDMYNYYMSDNSGEFTPPLLKAGGRKTESESPFGYIGSMASSAITEGVKNQSKLALYYFITNRPENDLMSASEVWYENTGMTEDGKRIFTPVYPPLTEDLSSESARKAYADWEKAMETKAKQGFAYKSAKDIDLNDSVIHIDDRQKDEHIIKFKVNGDDKMMFINGNPRAAQAINNMLNVNAAPSELVNALQKVLRYVAMINTQLNPEFWMTNMQRDLLFATMSESVKGDKAFNDAFRRNLMEARKVIKMRNAYNNGTLGDTPIEKLYREFVENGGVTGYSRVIGTEEWEREIRKFNKDDRKVIAAAKDVFEAIGGFGEAIEQLTRFAAYKTSREAGKGVIESVADAKELTVNFNRKGSGIAVTFDEAAKLRGADGKPLSKLEQALVVAASSLGAYGRAAIVFFNAAVQGLNNMVQLAKKQPKTMAIWTAGYFVLGVLNAALHAMLDDPDDDDYLDMPADERGNNLVLGGNGVYLKWALPQEMRVFYRLGDVLVNHALGRTPNKSVLGEMLHSVGEVSPIDFSSGVSALAPSVASPIVEIIKNEDWQGGRVYNDRKFMTKGEVKHHPKYTDPLKNTPEAYVAISKALNAISGGNSYEAGKVNVDPNILEHLFEGYTGGAGTSVEKLMVFLGNAAQGKFVVRNTPFLRRLLSISDERYRNAHVTELYYYYKDEAESTKRIYKKALKAGDEKMLEKLQRNGDLAVMQVYESFRKPMKTLDDDLKATQEKDTDQRKAIMRQQDAMRKEMIKQISELK